MSTPKALQLPSGVRRLTIETSRGKFAALEALPPSGVHERQPALLVPGYTGSKEDFLLILQALAAAGRQVVAIDMRGQFETPGADDAAPYQLGALAADVAMVADWLSEGHDGAASPGGPGSGPSGPGGGRGVHLLGHSLGGLVAREVLLARAARISSLILMSSGPGALSGQVGPDLRRRCWPSWTGSPRTGWARRSSASGGPGWSRRRCRGACPRPSSTSCAPGS